MNPALVRLLFVFRKLNLHARKNDFNACRQSFSFDLGSASFEHYFFRSLARFIMMAEDELDSTFNYHASLFIQIYLTFLLLYFQFL
jgi:hypothetical protein